MEKHLKSCSNLDLGLSVLSQTYRVIVFTDTQIETHTQTHRQTDRQTDRQLLLRLQFMTRVFLT